MSAVTSPAGMVLCSEPQGTPGWLSARRGVISASRFKDCRDRLADTPEKIDKKTGEITPAKRGRPSAKQTLYAMNTARELCGGIAPGAYQTHAMKPGQDEEPHARIAYEIATGHWVDEVGFLHTEDRKYGASADGIVLSEPGQRGAVEIKTMVSSENLFTAFIGGDASEFIDQCIGNIWLWHLDWIDLVLWTPDLTGDARIRIIRIERDEQAIEALKADLTAFDELVQGYVRKMREHLAGTALADELEDAPAAPPQPAPARMVPADIPEDIFA